MTTENLRIVSLIPSATEIVCKLGYGAQLVGRSHECDFPSFVSELPVCTEPKFDPTGTSAEIHQRVTSLLTHALSVYRVKTDLLAQLQPTHIITQAQCEVCAVSLADVEQAVATLPSSTPVQLVSLQPQTLADVWQDIERVAAALAGSAQTPPAAKALTAQIKASLPHSPSSATRPKVACIEWTDPLMAAGNWVPELVTLAGGKDCFGRAGKHSDWLTWQALQATDPDIIVVMPCGYDMAKTRQATQALAQHKSWSQLKAVRSGRVYLTDGNQYFNRPGPRLVESGDILAEIIHHKAPSPKRHPMGWSVFSGT